MPKHIVALTGAGISAESGLSTFRGNAGLWERYSLEDVATPSGWKNNPEQVLQFYNARRQQVREAKPNPAHYALARLAGKYQVSIITQNIDDLHERAGSKNVLHIHGEIMKARSTIEPNLIYDLEDKDIAIGDICTKGSQLRPHVVWFNEDVIKFPAATAIVQRADLLLVIGTSLAVYPAAGLIEYVKARTPIIVIAPDLDFVPEGITWFKEKAASKLPELVDKWLADGI